MASGRADQERVRIRVETVYHLLLQGDSLSNIVQNSSKSMGVSTRQVYKYAKRARALIKKEAARIREEAFDEHLVARRRMRKEAHDTKNGWLALAVLKDEAKLLDLYPAERQRQEGEIDLRIVRDGATSSPPPTP